MGRPLREVAVVGVGITPHGRVHLEKGWKNLLLEAAAECFADAGINAREVEAATVGYQGEIAIETGGIGPIVSDLLGISPAPVAQISANCCSSSMGLTAAFGWVASGLYDTVLVSGFEKLTDPIHRFELINVSFDTDYDYMLGFSHADGFSLVNEAYRRRYGYTLEPYARWAMQCDWYAKRNPKAMAYKLPPLAREDVIADTPAGENLRESAGGEAAAAVLLVPGERARRFQRHKPVYIRGISFKNTSHYLGHHVHYQDRGLPGNDANDLTFSQIMHIAAREAYRMAGITPEQVDLAQVYDRQAAGLVALESMGLFGRGEAGRAVMDGETGVTGRCPTCTDGGNVRFGFASGAKGVAQAAECVIQLRGEAGERQVPNARHAVASNTGGVFSQAGIAVFSNE